MKASETAIGATDETPRRERMMDGSMYEARVQTLYGVVLDAMKEGKTYGEVVALAQDWVKRYCRYYMRTCIEERDGRLYLVVRTCPTFADVGKPQCVDVNAVAVPEAFRTHAETWLRCQ